MLAYFIGKVTHIREERFLVAALVGSFAEQMAPEGLKCQLTDTEPGETLPGPCRRHNHHPGQRSLRAPEVVAGTVIPAWCMAGAELAWLRDRAGRRRVSRHCSRRLSA